MKKLQIIENINNLMYQVIFIFCLNFKKLLQLFLLLEKQIFEKKASSRNE